VGPARLIAPILGSSVDTWATVAVAIGTIGAVAYALFRDLVVTPRRRPRLDLRFDRAGNDQLVVATANGAEVGQVRLRVGNKAGKDTADDVVVLVTELGPDSPVHLPLMWSGTSPPLTVSSIHPGSERHVDLLHVDLPTGAASFDVSPQPAGGQHVLEPGTYEVSIEIRGRNADAQRYVIPLSWDGEASDRPALWDHLGLGAPRGV